MAAFTRFLGAGSGLQTATEGVHHQKLSAEYIKRQLQGADEENLLDEEDMHIFGRRPMIDPLDLVCCNACKKPIKASHYTAHAEICKSLISTADVLPELDGSAVKKKRPQKERKKLSIAHTRNARPNGTYIGNGMRVAPYSMHCSENVTLCQSTLSKRMVVENLSNPGAKSMRLKTAEIVPDAPAPLATKIYYSQRNHHLRRAIRHMFYGESGKESTSVVSHLETSQVHATATLDSSPCNFYPAKNLTQQGDDHLQHMGETPNQIHSASSEIYLCKPEGFIPPTNLVSQPPINSNLGSRYMSNSYSFAAKAGNPLGTVQQGNGSVQVL